MFVVFIILTIVLMLSKKWLFLFSVLLSNAKKDEFDIDKVVSSFHPFTKELQVEPKHLQPFQHLVSLSSNKIKPNLQLFILIQYKIVKLQLNTEFLFFLQFNTTTVKLGYNELGYNELGYNELIDAHRGVRGGGWNSTPPGKFLKNLLIKMQ